jgi:hypothetical protein
MRFVVILIQIVISLVVTASVTPALLFAIPEAREGRQGMALTAGVLLTTFLVIWLVWPRRSRRLRRE